jgi:predicted dehydrogenase
VHHIARHRHLFGNVSGLYAIGRPSRAKFAPFSALNALLSFEKDGNTVAGHYSFLLTGKETQAPLIGLRIFGTSGEIYLEDRHCGYINVSHKCGNHEVIQYNPGQGYYNELINLYEALRNGAELISTPEKEIGDMEVVFHMLESARDNKQVRVYGENVRDLKIAK